MSFRFNWNFIDVEALKEHSKEAITRSIAESKRPAIMADAMEVTDIDFGTRPPKLAFDSIKQVEVGRAHIVFRVEYDGDATITLETKLHANPLREVWVSPQWPEFVKPMLVGASNPLEIPFQLKLLAIHLKGFVDVVYTKQGLTVLFTENMVHHIETESSLDGVPGVNKMISTMLSGLLAESFDEDAPEMVWKVTNPDKKWPDPTLGPRRWRQHLIPKTMFRELGLGMAHIPEITPFNTLSLSAEIPGTILSSRVARRPSTATNVDMADLLADDTASEYSFASTTTTTNASETWRPRRRKINLRKVSEKLAAQNSASSTEKTPPAADQSRSAKPDLLNPQTPSTPPLTPEHAIVDEYDDSFHYSPHVIQLDHRRHSSPGLRNRHRKIRTTSLQPSVKPRIRRHTNIEPAFE